MVATAYGSSTIPLRKNDTKHSRILHLNYVDEQSKKAATNSVAVEDLAFLYWQYNANEKAYANRLITKNMYEFAREELLKSIDLLSKTCYVVSEIMKSGDGDRLIKDKAFIG